MSELQYIAHSGTKGMKWGNRRYQNKDGSLTPLGRAHYGVGAARSKAAGAIKKVGTAIRKKVAPTNAELNAQIRKQRSKNLNKQKRAELKELKKGNDIRQSSKKAPTGTHKKFYDMSDKEIQDRINRLSNEIKLADLEFQTSLGPGRRFAYGIVKDAGKQALTNIAKDSMTDMAKRLMDPEGYAKEKESEKVAQAAKDAANLATMAKKRREFVTGSSEGEKKDDKKKNNQN